MGDGTYKWEVYVLFEYLIDLDQSEISILMDSVSNWGNLLNFGLFFHILSNKTPKIELTIDFLPLTPLNQTWHFLILHGIET